MSDIIYRESWPLNEAYEGAKQRATQVLGGYQELFEFSDADRRVTFRTEKLIPAASTNRPRVMLLLSNPHPHSVRQGMFLSPNTRGLPSLFWSVMDAAGWLPIAKENRDPEQLADICLSADYQGPFELIFYCYYAFPTSDPKDIRKIFGKEYFSRFIEPGARAAFRKTVQETSVAAVVAFNGEIFNLASKDPVKRYTKHLEQGELVRSQLKGGEKGIPIFLTFPTGWRYHVQYEQLRVASLDRIRIALCRELIEQSGLTAQEHQGGQPSVQRQE